MKSLSLRKNGVTSVLALFLVASAAPLYALVTFDSAGDISVSRWLALYLIAAETAGCRIIRARGREPGHGVLVGCCLLRNLPSILDSSWTVRLGPVRHADDQMAMHSR